MTSAIAAAAPLRHRTRAIVLVVWMMVTGGIAVAREGTMSTSPDLGAQLAAVANHGTLAITTVGRRSGKPHTVPIWFVVESTTVYLGTLSVKRDWVKNALKNPDVKLDVAGLHLRGRLTTITDPMLTRRVHGLIAGKYWMAWIGSWFGKGPEGVFRVDDIALATG